jgi:hypothetical protein
MKFNKEFLSETVLYSGSDQTQKTFIVVNSISETSRWSEYHYLVFSHKGNLYETSYSQGLTESQDESPWEYDSEEIECAEVEAYEKTVTAYRKKQ